MATRRSRLQVKPNIGGPKIGGAKPPPLKIPDHSGKKTDGVPGSPLKSPKITSPVKSPRTTSPVKSPRTTSPVKSPRITSPLKSPRVPYPIRGTTSKVTSPVKSASAHPLSQAKVEDTKAKDEDEQLKIESGESSKVESQNDELNENDAETQGNNKRSLETTENSNSSSEKSTQAPKRARLRRFGTVNVGTARGTKTTASETQPVGENPILESPRQKDEDKNQKEAEVVKAATYSISDDSEERIGEREGDLQRIAKKQDVVSDSEKTGDKPKEAEKTKPKPGARARLPKVKPNFQEASRKRLKPNEESSSVADIGQESSPSQPPSDAAASVSASETPAALHSIDDALTPPVKHTAIQPKPTLPKSPQKGCVAHPLHTTPSKTGGKLMSGDKDKWSKPRTVSTSEPHTQPPPPKRAKRPVVDAPTDKPPDRSTMRMRDLIHWNPSSNPMKVKEKKIPEAKDKVKEKENKGEEPQADQVEEDEAMPVPQVTIGPDGNIVINEQSLVVKNTVEDKGPSQDDDPIDETEMFSTYGTFRKISRSRRWSEKETAKFYKALAMVGIDFFLIQKMMPNRQRFELKKKFKNEERKNGPLIERVLRERLQFDDSVFENVSSEEEDEKELKKKAQKEKRERLKRERGEKKKANSAQKKKTRLRGKSRNPISHFEPDGSSSDSEVEREMEKNFKGDPNVSEPSVSKTGKDREVVGILMDMSEGRLPGTSGVQTDVTTNSNGVNVPPRTVNQSYADDTVSLTTQSTPQVLGNNNNNLLMSLPRHIPGLQNIISACIQTQPLYPQGVEPVNIGSDLRTGDMVNAESETSNTGIHQTNYMAYTTLSEDMGLNQPMYTAFRTNSEAIPGEAISQQSVYHGVGETVTQVSANLSDQIGLNNNVTSNNQAYSVQSAISNLSEVEHIQNSSEIEMVNDEIEEVKKEVQAVENSVPNILPVSTFNGDQIISQQLLSPQSAAQFPGLPQTGPNDRYVLVTVMPESGQETIIHVYRLHGGQLSQ